MCCSLWIRLDNNSQSCCVLDAFQQTLCYGMQMAEVHMFVFAPCYPMACDFLIFAK